MTLREIGEAEYSSDQGVSAPTQPGDAVAKLTLLLTREQMRDAIAAAPDDLNTLASEAGSWENVMNTIKGLTASSQCPMCGQNFPHEHSPQEIVIYKNGMKSARVLSSAPTDTVVLLREARHLLMGNSATNSWAIVDSLCKRIDAHLSSAQSAGVQEMVWVIVRTDVNEPCSAHTDQRSAEIRQAVFSFNTKIVGIPLYAAASAKAWIDVGERQPEHAGYYFAMREDDVVQEACCHYFDGDVWLFGDGSDYDKPVVRWMDIPPIAAAASERGGSDK